MASKIKVDQLETADGSGTIALQNQLSGLTSSSMPTGSVLQVLQHNLTGSYIQTTSTSYVATGLTKTITPSSTSNKIKVEFSFLGDAGDTSSAAWFTVKKGSTNLASNANNAFTGISLVSNGRILTSVSHSYLDSPNTTSAITYEVYMKSANSSHRVRLRTDESVATLILTEIKG